MVRVETILVELNTLVYGPEEVELQVVVKCLSVKVLDIFDLAGVSNNFVTIECCVVFLQL